MNPGCIMTSDWRLISLGSVVSRPTVCKESKERTDLEAQTRK